MGAANHHRGRRTIFAPSLSLSHAHTCIYTHTLTHSHHTIHVSLSNTSSRPRDVDKSLLSPAAKFKIIVLPLYAPNSLYPLTIALRAKYVCTYDRYVFHNVRIVILRYVCVERVKAG